MKKIFLYALALLFATSCSDEEANVKKESISSPIKTRSVITDSIAWENIDFMPTPPGTVINSPWSGSGSLLAFYDLDVVNDRMNADGWELVYNTFSTTAMQANPYFVLYNKYRGLLRFYLYVTSNVSGTSSYLKDGLRISTTNNAEYSILNFIGSEFVDGSDKKMRYIGIQPEPLNGGSPFASNRWYMMQYELAYDPTISSASYNNIKFEWSLNYIDIFNIELGGTANSVAQGTIGGGGNNGNNFYSALKNTGVSIGKLAVTGIGANFLNKNRIDSTGSNKLGLPSTIFNSLSSGLSGALSSIGGGLPGVAFGMISGIISGSLGTTPQAISMNIDTNVKMEGTAQSEGSLPSGSIDFYIPGSTIVNTVPGYLPLYTNKLGVLNFTVKPQIEIEVDSYSYQTLDYQYGSWMITETVYNAHVKEPHPDYSQYLIFNPDVQQIANINVLRQDIIFRKTDGTVINNPVLEAMDSEIPSSTYSFPDGNYYVHFLIEVSPKNGSTPVYIYKSFLLDDVWTYNPTEYVGILRNRNELQGIINHLEEK